MIYLDIETLDFFQDEHIKAIPDRNDQLKAIRFGIAVTFDSDNNQWYDWTTDEAFRLLFSLAQSQTQNVPIVGWNIKGFGLPVIANSTTGIAKRNDYYNLLATGNIIDLFDDIRKTTGRWYKLEEVSSANLNSHKLADGQTATHWLRTGDPDALQKAFDYCRQDVQLVIDLHNHLLAGNSLLLPHRAHRQELNDIRWTFDHVERIVGEDGVLGTR